MAVVELKHIDKRYPNSETLAVSDFNLKTNDGEFVVLVGPSGCGKTTTLRMVAGLEEHTDGQIFIGERDVTGVAARDRDIAMVFQSYALYPHMTVRDNMGFSLKLKKYAKTDIKQRVDSVAQILDIEDLLERKPRALSGGQRQRVALGRAIVRQPQVFLMDEPLSNLDAKLRVDMRTEIIKLHHRLGVTTFYVTHDQTEAMTMGQRIAVMRAGVAQQIDTPDNLYQSPANRFVAGFIGTPSMNFLTGRVADGKIAGENVTLALDDARLAAVTRAGVASACAGIRPEHLRVAGKNETCTLRGTVEVVETLGAINLLHVRVAGSVLTAQVAPHHHFAIGDAVTLACNTNRLYLFHPDSDLQLHGIDSSAVES